MIAAQKNMSRCIQSVLDLYEICHPQCTKNRTSKRVFLRDVYRLSLQIIIVYTELSKTTRGGNVFFQKAKTWHTTCSLLKSLPEDAYWSQRLDSSSTIWKEMSIDIHSLTIDNKQWKSFLTSLLSWSWDSFALGYYHQEMMRIIQKQTQHNKSYVPGVFYTPQEAIEQTINRLLDSYPSPPSLQHMNICDPACGCGFFLIYLAKTLTCDPALTPQEHARFVQERIFGVDIDPIAVELTQWNLYWLVDKEYQDMPRIRSQIQCANTLFSDDQLCTNPYIPPLPFDIIIGNPPWISYSGKHAEPLPLPIKKYYQHRFQSAKGWISLAALFIERSLELLTETGSLALLVPVQLCDLEGYSSFRTSILDNADPIEPFPFFSASLFGSISTPSVAFILKKRKTTNTQSRCFVVSQSASQQQKQILNALKKLPKPPAKLFIDCGVHTGNCASQLIHNTRSEDSVPVYEGKNLSKHGLEAPLRWLNLSYAKKEGEYFNIRHFDTYQSCAILIRQTASKPIACVHHPKHYFRNSILGCTGLPHIPDKILMYWLNSSLIEWFHTMTIRESKQKSFPQIKIGHLRNLPLPNIEAHHVEELTKMHSITEIDEYMSRIAGLTGEEHSYIQNDIASGFSV